MNFFKNIFKKQTNLQDVFSALDNFSNDTKTLNDFKNVALAYFGNNWKFNLEMYISSLPSQDKSKYLEIFKTVLDYEHALDIWTSAMQIVNGIKPVSAEILKSMSEYQTYLSKFGIEGERLFEKLNTMFDIVGSQNMAQVKIAEDINQIKDSEYQDNENSNSDEIEKETEDIYDSDAKIEEHFESNDDSFVDTNETKDEVIESELNPEIKPKTILDDKQEYQTKLKQKILQKVKEIELRKNKINKDVEEEVKKEEVKEEISNNQSIENGNTSNNQENNDWILENFKKIEDFLLKSREIMSAITLSKNVKSLEEYKNYGFILDIMDYLIEKGSEILSLKTDDEIKKYFVGGRKELNNIIQLYKNEKNNEVIIPEHSDNPIKNDTK